MAHDSQTQQDDNARVTRCNKMTALFDSVDSVLEALVVMWELKLAWRNIVK